MDSETEGAAMHALGVKALTVQLRTIRDVCRNPLLKKRGNWFKPLAAKINLGGTKSAIVIKHAYSPLTPRAVFILFLPYRLPIFWRLALLL
jgi:hypothetical protein